MNTAGLPEGVFTASPHWEWLIVFYFFVGGIAGGAYFLAALIDFSGRPEDRPLARLGYLIALPAVIVSGVLLILDLTRPLRFWHMLLESKTWQPMFKAWSPMSVGSWALLIFGLFAGVSFLAALGDPRRPRSRGLLGPFRPPHPLGILWTILGGLVGFFVAGYTGVLLSVTNRVLWTDTNLLGLLFLLSGASTAAALMILLARGRRWTPGVAALTRLDTWVLVLELVALVALIATLQGGVIRAAWLNWWGVILVVGVFLLGIVLPLIIEARPRAIPGLGLGVAAALVLLGGFLLRVVMLLSPNAVRVAGLAVGGSS